MKYNTSKLNVDEVDNYIKRGYSNTEIARIMKVKIGKIVYIKYSKLKYPKKKIKKRDKESNRIKIIKYLKKYSSNSKPITRSEIANNIGINKDHATTLLNSMKRHLEIKSIKLENPSTKERIGYYWDKDNT